MRYDISGLKGKVAELKDNPLVSVFLIAFLVGGGTTAGINGITDHRPDKYTGEMGEADRKASIARYEVEARERKDEDARILERILENKTKILSLQEYQSNHRVESARGFAKIYELEKELSRHLNKEHE